MRKIKIRLIKTLLLFLVATCDFFLPLEAGQTICLNMIVKNESRVIERCLRSVMPLIDHWVIVDTGSTDGTQKIIREFLHDIPGELYERPWVDFAHNRNEALQLAKEKGDYILTVDADEELIYDDGFVRPLLDRDFYLVVIKGDKTQFKRNLLFNNHLYWEWIGVLHEFLQCREAKNWTTLKGVVNLARREGCRSQDENWWKHDVEVLEKALLKEPDNARYIYYLAKSYLFGKENLSALKNFEKRIGMGERGNPEQLFSALYQTALLQQYELKTERFLFLESYFKAYHSRPTRAEPLYHIGRYYREQGDYFLGYLLLKYALSLPCPDDSYPVETWIYEHGLLMESSLCAYYLGKYRECKEMCDRMLADSKLPQEVRELVLKNLEWVYPKLASNK